MERIKDTRAASTLSTRIRAMSGLSGIVAILASVLTGLVLARFTMVSPSAAVVALLSAVALCFALFVRRIDYLFIGWAVTTTFVWAIMTRLMPQYYAFVGRGLFYGGLACMVVAWGADNILRGRRFIHFDNVPLKASVLAFLIWGTIAVASSQDVILGAKKLSHVVIAFISSYMFYDFFSRDQNHIRKVLKIVSLLIVAVSFITIVTGLESLVSGVSLYKRLKLWFWNPNTLGTFLFICLPMILTAGLNFVSSSLKRTFLIAIILVALFLSFHRTSWLSASVAIVFIMTRTGRLKLPVAVAIVGCLFLAGFVMPFKGEDIYDFVTGERYTGRTEIWKAAIKSAGDHPFLGTGPGTSVSNISEHIESPWLKDEDTHSMYLKNAVEMGWPSVVVVLFFYAAFFYFSIRIEKNLNSQYLKLVTQGATATMLGMMFYGFFENGFVMTPFDASEFTVIWPYIAMMLPFAAKRIEEREDFRS